MANEQSTYHVHAWVERNVSVNVEAENADDARDTGMEEIKDQLRTEGIPVDKFVITTDEVVEETE